MATTFFVRGRLRALFFLVFFAFFLFLMYWMDSFLKSFHFFDCFIFFVPDILTASLISDCSVFWKLFPPPWLMRGFLLSCIHFSFSKDEFLPFFPYR